MFAPMRRRLQQLPEERARAILLKATSAVLAIADEEYPYAVPVSFSVEGDNIYIHGAPMGHRAQAMKKHPKVSLCIIESDNIVPEKLTTYFRSVVIFGTARTVNDPILKRRALKALAEKYSPGFEKEADKEIEDMLNYVNIVEIHIDHMTGKESIEYVNARK